MDGGSTSWREGNYSTHFYTDKIIEYIDGNQDDDRPFFALATYTSPHWPLLVDRKYWEKYKGQYDDGYEKLRAQRLASLKDTGIIPSDLIAPPTHERVMYWDSLPNQEKKEEARIMELYAGMVDNLDHNIGRLIAYLKNIGEYENTLFVFMSDSGAAHRDFINDDNLVELRTYYNDDYDHMGKANSYISYGPQWAEAGSSPFRYFKDYATQGGIITTMIIIGPNVSRENKIHHGFTSLLDLAPTFFDVADVDYPVVYNGNEVYPLKGNSVIPFASGDTDEIHDSEYVFALEHYGNAMLRKGKWKITNFIRTFEVENLSPYDLSNDIGEKVNLEESEKDKYDELLGEWIRFSNEVKIQTSPPSPKEL